MAVDTALRPAETEALTTAAIPAVDRRLGPVHLAEQRTATPAVYRDAIFRRALVVADALVTFTMLGALFGDASVNFTGNDGFDTVQVVGTAGNDQYVLTTTGVIGTGVVTQQVESFQIDAGAGDDAFYVVGTRPGMSFDLLGGTGSDTFSFGGDIPEIRSGTAVLNPATAGSHRPLHPM